MCNSIRRWLRILGVIVLSPLLLTSFVILSVLIFFTDGDNCEEGWKYFKEFWVTMFDAVVDL